ncbi:MAG: SAM-dependent methyltransferase [Chloroflexi bacterium]|nr:MAG: SAM-dependent methyltransferase [Chloroflexota bacterium]
MPQPELRIDNGQANLNQAVRAYWEAEPCGTEAEIVGDRAAYSPEWFAQIETYRYAAEPFIHAFAQFTRHHGKRVLEVGVGAGTDHLQWARAGAICYGIDLTAAGVVTTREHLALHGFRSALQQVDAEAMPFPNEFFDVAYSWGVIHHAEHPERIIQEIWRVLKPGGAFIGMMYNRHSLAVYKYWVRHALLKGKPGRSLADVVWHHVESIGTKAYTVDELRRLFAVFGSFSATPILTRSDYGRLPTPIRSLLPAHLGWFIAVRAVK